MTRPGPLGRRRAPSSSSTSSSSTMGSGGIRRSGISAPGPSSNGWITKHRQLNPRVYEIGASPPFPERLLTRISRRRGAADEGTPVHLPDLLCLGSQRRKRERENEPE